MGQNSENARVISGNLEAWAGFADGQIGQIIATPPVTIWFMNDQLWLSWTAPLVQVPVAGGAANIW
jgi:hypothetical protein